MPVEVVLLVMLSVPVSLFFLDVWDDFEEDTGGAEVPQHLEEKLLAAVRAGRHSEEEYAVAAALKGLDPDKTPRHVVGPMPGNLVPHVFEKPKVLTEYLGDIGQKMFSGASGPEIFIDGISVRNSALDFLDEVPFDAVFSQITLGVSANLASVPVTRA